MRKRALRSSVSHFLVALALLLVGSGCAYAASPPSATPDPRQRVTPVVEAYRKVSPAVVNISTERLVHRGVRMFGMDEDDPFQDFLSDPFGESVPAVSLGSGFIIHSDGYIVTNAHVVGRGGKITVSLADKSTFAATVVASSTDHDLAVLRLEATKGRKFDAVTIGRSDDLMIGESVIAIGNPLGYQNTCTTGVISALDRKLTVANAKYEGIIQVDAPINPGNSGGPLLNILGELIGINTAIRADAQGIGFAIPVDALLNDFPRLLDYERLNRLVVGFSVQQQHGKDADELVVSSVVADSPAAAAGVEKGDRILAVNDRAMRQISDFQITMLSVQPAEATQVRLRRGDRERVAVVIARQRPKADGPALAWRLLGLQLELLTPELSQKLELPLSEGMLVTGLQKGGLGEQLGLRRGDIVFQLGKWYMKNWDGVSGVLEDAQGGDSLRIGILRGNTRAWATFRLPAADAAPASAPAAPDEKPAIKLRTKGSPI